MKQTILGVFPHPDDEISAAGLLSRAIERGNSVHIICATRGEAGRIKNNSIKSSDNILDIRTKEVDKSCKLLGVSSLQFLDVKDNRADTWVEENVEEKLEDLIIKINPDLIITFDKNGVNGHSDHMETSRITKFAYNKFRKEKDVKLFYVTAFPISFIKRNLLFIPIPKSIKGDLTRKFAIDDNFVTFLFKLSKKELNKKIEMIKCHKSQFPDEKGRYFNLPLIIFKKLARYESYYCEEIEKYQNNKIIGFI